MKRIALILLTFMTIQAPALELKGNALLFTEADIQTCNDGGGCVVLTKRAITEIIEKRVATGCSKLI